MIAPFRERPPISLVAEGLGEDEVSLYVGGAEGARDVALLAACGITTVVNCAINLDINYVSDPLLPLSEGKCAAGHGPVRSYKIGLIDDDGNPGRMMLAGYYILDGALRQVMPERDSYPHRRRGNVLVHCRSGRSRSVALASLYLARSRPDRFPTLDAAIAHLRQARDLREEEWFETPKPMLIKAARGALLAIELLDRDEPILASEAHLQGS